MLCYHGTSADNLQSILKNGLIASSDKIWTCSLTAVYCWTKNYIDRENIDVEDHHNILIEQACQSGFCSLGKAKDTRVVVVVFEVDDEELEIDDSCPNMESANCIDRDISIEEIKEVIVSNDLSLLKGYFLHMISNMELHQHKYELTNLEEKVIQFFENAEIYPEDIDSLLELKTVYKKGE